MWASEIVELWLDSMLLPLVDSAVEMPAVWDAAERKVSIWTAIDA